MKLLEMMDGRIVAFGFDMVSRKPNMGMVAWNDPVTGEWEPTATNTANSVTVRWRIDPEFVREVGKGFIAYQPGLMIEGVYTGSDHVFSVRTFRA